MNPIYLHVGGLFAMGFDPTGQFLLTVSHSGRGVFDVKTWQRVARDPKIVFPENGCMLGIGPIEDVKVDITEKNYTTDVLNLCSVDGALLLEYDAGCITVSGRDPRSGTTVQE